MNVEPPSAEPSAESSAESSKDDPVNALAAEVTPETRPSEPVTEPVADWREQLSAKMQQYRTRRKPRAPKYPSLQMALQLPVEPFQTPRPLSADASRSSNALEPVLEPTQISPQLGPELVQSAPPSDPEPVLQAFAPTNLIEFPRSMESEAWDGLAEPVIEQPRILDTPEFSPPVPALGGILLETPPDPDPVTQADHFVRPATILRRGLALFFDLAFVASATFVWGWVAARIAGAIPPQPLLLISGVVSAAALGLIYQYLLMVYSGTTLGLLACRIELVSIEGTTPDKKRRRWRFLASLLSASSMMLGYAWVLLDDKQLCWHDRITHTYLRVREQPSL